MTWYLLVRSNPTYSESTPTEPLAAFLQSDPSLTKEGPMEFIAAEGRPWVYVRIAECDRRGGYGPPLYRPSVNVVDIACGNDVEDSYYHSLANRIATFVGWEVADPHTDP